MKKSFYPALIIFFLLTFLAGCSNESLISPNEQETSPNRISPMVQTQDLKEIIDLLETDKQEILFFEYETEDAYKGVEFWVEVYKDGELVDRPASSVQTRDEGSPLNGTVAITITQNPNYQWTFVVRNDGAKSRHTGESSIIIDDELVRGYTPIDYSIEIENGKEIVLYTSMFSDGDMTMYGEQQRYVKEPELMKAYPYMHIIKCKFTM